MLENLHRTVIKLNKKIFHVLTYKTKSGHIETKVFKSKGRGLKIDKSIPDYDKHLDKFTQTYDTIQDADIGHRQTVRNLKDQMST